MGDHETDQTTENRRLPDPREIELAERRRLSQELHDAVTQHLYSLVVLGEAWRRQIRAGDLQPALGHIEELTELARQALREARLLIYELQPPELDAGGLLGALQNRLELVEHHSGIKTRLIVTDERGEPLDRPFEHGRPVLTAQHLPQRIEYTLFRIAQEALNNALRHSNAGLITVTFAVGDKAMALTISDDGRGFDPATRPAVAKGYGIQNMRERAEGVGGRFQLISAPGTGTTVRVTGIPITEDV